MASVLFGSCLGSDTNRCWAQGLFRSNAEIPDAEFLPAPRIIRQQIREAEQAIEEERFSDAVLRLGNLLRRSAGDDSETPSQDYFLPDDDAELPTILGQLQQDAPPWPTQSVIERVKQLIAGLPQAGWDMVQLRYGPLAKKMLDEAAETQDWEAVQQVRRDFFYTHSGIEASVLLAQRQWHLGNPLATSLLLDGIVSSERALDYLQTLTLADDALVLHGIASRISGRDLTLPPRTIGAFQKHLDGQPANMETWEFWIDNLIAAADEPIEATQALSDYAFLGGLPNRNDSDQGQMPLSNPRWMVEATGSPRQERLIDAETRELKASGILPPPSWTPLRVGGQLLMRTTQRLLGVDYRTGKRVWQYPWFSPAETIQTQNDDDSGRLDEEDDPTEILAQRVWNDVPYGQISSDGQRVYMIDDLGKVEMERFSPFQIRQMRSAAASSNTLVALDLATEGKLLWQIGASADTTANLSDVFFLGPPLPIEDKLYVIAEIAGEIVLLALNSRDGSEAWRQVLVSVDSGGITTDPVRRIAGAMPTYHQGLLICPTGAGVTIAIDLVDRTLRWGNRHPRNQEFARNVFRPTAEIPMNQLSQRWSRAVPIATGTTVILTPVESDRLLVVDALTGQNRFAGQTRARKLYVAGIRGDQYFVVAADKMWSHNLQDGTINWATSPDLMSPGQRVSGHGVFSSSSYFLPTSSDELVEVSLETGEVLSRRTVRFPLGNLLAVGGEIVSQATTTLAVAYGEESLQPRVDKILAEDPDDLDALVRKAELLMEQNERAEAMRLLERARELDPTNDDVILLSVDAMLSSLGDPESAAQVDVEALTKLIDRPEQKAELLVLQIHRLLPTDDGSITAETATSAFDLAMQLSALLVKEPSLSKRRPSVLTDPSREFTLNAWLAAKIASITRGVDEQTLTQLQDKLTTHFQGLTRYDQNALAQITSQFVAMPTAIAVRKSAMQEHLLNRGDALAIERSVWASREAREDKIDQLTTAELLTLANLYSETGWADDRRWIGEVIQQRMQAKDDDTEEQQQEKAAVLEQLERYTVMGVSRGQPHTWPTPVAMDWQTTTFNQARILVSERRYAQTTRWLGQQTLGWQAVSDNNPLALLNHNGISRAIVIDGLTTRNATDKEITMSGGLMLVLTPSELIAVDLFRVLAGGAEDPVRWRMTLGAGGGVVAKRRSSITVFGDQIYRYLMNSTSAFNGEPRLKLGPIFGDRVFLLLGNDLLCLSAISGEQLWRTSTQVDGTSLIVAPMDEGEETHLWRVGVISEKQNQNHIAWFDSLDGRPLNRTEVPDGDILASHGRFLLHVSRFTEESELDDPYLIQLLDSQSMQPVLKRVASSANRTDQARTSAYAELIEGRYFGLLDNQGHATLWDVATGDSIADVKIPVRESLFGLSIMHVDGKFILMPRSRLPGQDVDPTTTVTVSGGAAVKGLTAAHAIDDSSGEVLWSQSFDDTWGVTVNQPWSTPMMLVVRGRSHYASNATRRRELDVRSLDIQSGDTIYERMKKEVSPRTNLIETQMRLIPGQDKVIATLQSELLTYRFGEEEETE